MSVKPKNFTQPNTSLGLDAVDAKAGPYENTLMRGPKGENVLDSGARVC
jgi:hypothetical protein